MKLMYKDGLRFCSGWKTGNIKPHYEDPSKFPKRKATKLDGLHNMCKACKKAQHKWHNAQRYGKDAKPHLRRTYSIDGAKSRAERILRYPQWISKKQEQQIEAIYKLRDELNKCHEKPYWHVDHIMPLVGKEVSGLHVPENLQLVPSRINLSKSNQWNWETQS